MPAVPPGQPKPAPKPTPIGNMTLVVLVTTCVICALFILWKRAESFRTVVAHRLKTFRNPEGRIRLSEEDGPQAHEFLDDEEIDDDIDDEPLTERPLARSSPNTAAAESSRIRVLPS